ncbi:Cadherin-87A [Portunus trituberculatus]|uniref:Cadherin-87A n=1 Tax=Portunus trituberculatus TaxID=210409 RepID=A0A5B7J7Z2_PORTR|nr:Cadherin-87A [Portunus trituberculatus]
MNLHVVSESTPVGAAVYTLKGSDPEGSPVMFGLSGTDRLRVDPNSGVVTVVRPLDREVSSYHHYLCVVREFRATTDFYVFTRLFDYSIR